MSITYAGAIYGDDELRPLHFGDPFGEQLDYEAGTALAVLGPVGLVSVSGTDRQTWLTTLSSQVLTGKPHGTSQELLLLDSNGRIEYAAGVINDDTSDTTWLMVEPQQAEPLVQFLESMKFMSRVEIEDKSGQYLAFSAARNADATPPEGTLRWDDPWPGVEDGGAQYYQGKHPAHATATSVYLVPERLAGEFAAETELKLAGTLAAEATRVAAWRPRWAAEVDSRTMPAELDWLRTAVHVNKGCYCGQESVARILNLGKPPRRLTFLQLDGSQGNLPAPGDAVEFSGRQVGVITSVARHAEMGPIALALLKRGLDPEAALTVGTVAAAQELIVPVEGKSDHSPAERPGAGMKRIDHGGRDIRTRGPGAGGR